MPFDDEIDDAQDAVNDGESGAKEVGEGKQDVDQAQDDLQDGDQDTADKGSNVGHGAADAVDHGDQALKDWRILDDGDTSISDIADGIDDATEAIFGKKAAPDSLPPVRYRLFFGKVDDLEAGLENLLDDGLGIVDSAVEGIGGAVGQYIGTDPFSSVMEKHSPFAEDHAELDRLESRWKVAQVVCDEGLNRLWRCELLLVTDEYRNPDLEDEYGQQSSAGGLVNEVAGPIKGVMDTVDQIGGVFSGDPNAAPPESPLAKRVAGIKDSIDDLKSARDFGDAMGAVSDLVFGAQEWKSADQPVYINIPVDPGQFLGQTCSLRVSREFSVAPGDPASNDVPGHSFSARYLTGVVVEMDDLGTRAAPLPPGVGSTEIRTRWIRLVVMPQLAKLAWRRDHRVFNDMHAIAIVREVFRSAGVYGFLPDVPGVGMATGALGDAVSNVPFVGNAAADALSGQFIKLMPPPSADASLAGHGARLAAEDWTPVREMCVQYGETDLDFVRRILEEEGIHFTFTCRRGFERIVLAHDPSELDEAPTVDGRPTPYFWPHWQAPPPVEVLTGGAEWREVRPARVTLRDFSYSNAAQTATEQAEPLANSPGALAGVTAGASQQYGERYEYPGDYRWRYLEGDDAIHYADYGSHPLDRNLALLRLEEEASAARRVSLTTNLIGAGGDANLRLRGYTFDRDNLVIPPTDGPPPADRVVIERVRWRGTGRGTANVLSGPNYPLPATTPPDYENEITGWWINQQVPATTPIRPRRVTRKPRVTSMTTATVVDWTGDHDEEEEIEHEHPTTVRVRVRFHWDRRGELPLGILPPIGIISPRGTTCWCRVAQGWAGDDFGVLFVPRVGTEVVVAFEHGDPDRPVVVGSLYDGEHPVPQPGRERARDGFTPPKAEPVQLSTIATHTTPWDDDDGVASELTFDDTAGGERVLLKAGRHLIEEVYGEHQSRVGEAQSNEVTRHHGEIVEQRQKVTVGGDRAKTVGLSQTETIRGTRTVKIGEDQKVLVTLDHSETVGGVVTLIGKGDRTLTVHGERSTKVGDPDDAEPAHDIHDITGAKTDTIEGTFKGRAKSVALGEPGDGEDAPDASIVSGEGGEPGVTAKADTAIGLAADGEVRIVSETAGVELEAADAFSALVSVPMIELGQPASGGATIWHDERVEVHTDNGVFVCKGSELRLRAMDEADALVVVSDSGVLLSGRTGVVDATKEIRDASGVQTVGE